MRGDHTRPVRDELLRSYDAQRRGTAYSTEDTLGFGPLRFDKRRRAQARCAQCTPSEVLWGLPAVGTADGPSDSSPRVLRTPASVAALGLSAAA